MVAAYTFRPAVRENTPLVIGIAGPTKSGKTYSALRLARGLSPSAPIIMLNAEGARGHQYADKFAYLTCDLVPPYRYGMYEEALRAAAATKPGAIIVDSMSHAHDGPGGFLEWHEKELDRIAGQDYEKRQKANFTAWIIPKAAENSFRYALLEMPCPVILCMRAKEKLKIVGGQAPVNLGWQPIVGEGIAFETIFTLTLPPYSKGVPDLAVSELREPFDTLIPKGKPIDEQLGKVLTEWAKGRAAAVITTILEEIQTTVASRYPGQTPADKDAKAQLLEKAFGSRSWAVVKAMDELVLRAGLETLRAPIQMSSAQAPDGGAADHTKGPKAPTEAREGAASTAAPGSTKVSPPKEPAKAGDEPAPGLFPSGEQLTPTTPSPAASTAQVRGIDVDDESQALVKLIEAEKEKLQKQPPDAIWETLCESIAGTAVLDMADPAALNELLDVVKKLVENDSDTIEKVRGIVTPAT